MNVIFNKIHQKFDNLPFVETFATSRQPKKGKCSNSCFANGQHRTGIIPLVSVLDNGASGDVSREVCLECGKVFKNGYFHLIKQPNTMPYKTEKQQTTGHALISSQTHGNTPPRRLNVQRRENHRGAGL